MINLLPPDMRNSYHFAHANTYLIRWVFAGGIGIVGLAILGGLGLLYLQQTTRSLDSQINSLNATLKTQKLAETKSETEDISGSLKLAVTVLSKEVMFSQLLQKMGKITPNNVSLTDLTISQEQQGVDITAQTADYNTATQLQVNLEDPKNELFQKADIVSITCGNEETTTEESDSRYPCTVILRALFVKDNPYLFINDGKKKS
jgi:Tfp pilus assembly protein PilN